MQALKQTSRRQTVVEISALGKQTPRPSTAEDWRRLIADANDSRARAEQRINDLAAERKRHALDARLGDRDARQRCDTIAEEIAALRKEADEAGDVIATAEAETRKLREAEAKAAREATAGKVEALLQERAEIVQGIDAAMATLAAQLQAAQDNAARIAALVSIDSSVGMRARSPSRIAYAAQHHGLQEFIPMDRMSPLHRKPYAEVDRAYSETVEAAITELRAGNRPDAA